MAREGVLHAEFKSDRCGIEMNGNQACQNRSRLFKSDRCGIEITNHPCVAVIIAKFKSDRCGIEIYTQNTWHVFEFKSSNQTVAGLKYQTAHNTLENRLGSNQTVAGLKCSYVREGDVCARVQIRPLRDWNISARVIIYVIRIVQIRPLRDWNLHVNSYSWPPSKFKSDRCGIEISIPISIYNFISLFKSDRCGIEIALTCLKRQQ